MSDLHDITQQLERIVPQDLSEWPPYAQALYLQSQLLSREIGEMQAKILRIKQEASAAEKAAQAAALTVADHEHRIKTLELLAKWALGLGTAILTAMGAAVVTGTHR